MARTFDVIPEDRIPWLEAQPVFFVASAPAGLDGHVNVSPKGGDTFRVLGPREVAYLDLTGSGAETVAHLRENGRLTIMFCSFGAEPLIVRLYGRGSVVLPDDPRWADLASRFPDLPGARSVVHLAVDRIATACGFSVPLMDLVRPRTKLDAWAARKGDESLAAYRAQKNRTSIDGLPALDPEPAPAP